jgi:hypothetical protein
MLVFTAYLNEKAARKWCLVVIAALFFGTSVGSEPRPIFLEGFPSHDDSRDLEHKVWQDCLRCRGERAAVVAGVLFPYIHAAVAGCTAGISAGACLIFLGLGETGIPWRRRVLYYVLTVVLAFLVRLVLPSLILLMWPSEFNLQVALGTGRWLLLPLVAVVTDLGYLFGMSSFAARHGKRLLAACAVAAILSAGVFWKPIAAEYFFWKGFHNLEEDSERISGKAALERAFRLNPRNERNLYVYVTYVLSSRAVTLLWLGDCDAALKTQLEAIALLPRDPSLHDLMGSIHEGRKDFHSALQARRRALELTKQPTSEYCRNWIIVRPADSEIHKRLIGALARHGAKESLEEIAGYLAGDDSDSAVLTAEALREGHFPQTLPLLEKAREHAHPQVRKAVQEAIDRIHWAEKLDTEPKH